MEGFELIATGLWSIVPPILALVLALITKEVYSSLTIGVFTGMIDVYKRQRRCCGVDVPCGNVPDGGRLGGIGCAGGGAHG